MIKHTKEHKAEWLSSMMWCKDCKKYIGEKGILHFACEHSDCEVNQGGYDCPRCASNGYRRVMDESEKEQGYCGDCGLEMAFKSGKLGNGLMIKK